MKIAILGTGPIGSTFALHLSRAGHDVTVIARGNRLAQLQAEQAIVTVDGERAAVTVSPVLDPSIAYDLVLVTVLAAGVDVVLPALRASAAKTVMFMFNTFAPLSTLRDAVGESRFAFGFPAILATLPDGKLKFDIVKVGQTTITTDAAWASVFSQSGIKTVVERDMESWLRTHAVMIAVTMSLACTAHTRGAGVTWDEARTYAFAMKEGTALVKHLGNAVIPAPMAALGGMPIAMLTSVLWSASRVKLVRDLGAVGAHEPRALIDAMSAIAPDRCEKLRGIRP